MTDGSPMAWSAPGARPAPVSLAQQWLLVLGRLRPPEAMNMQAVFELPGTVDLTALHSALAGLVARHETLRTRFVRHRARHVQMIDPPWSPEVRVTDLSSDPDTSALARALAAERAEPFDLARGPLLRATVVRPSAAAQVLVVTVHHLVFDWWSQRVLQRDLGLLYQAMTVGGQPALAPLTFQYGDYARRQRDDLERVGASELLALWRSRLGGTQPLRLRPDRPHPPAPGSAGKSQSFGLSAELGDAVLCLAVTARATPFMVLLGAFAFTLVTWSRQEDVVIASEVANRSRPETRPLIGLLASTVLLRLDCSGDPTFLELLGRLRETVLDALRHDIDLHAVLRDRVAECSSGQPAGGPSVVFQFRNEMRLPAVTDGPLRPAARTRPGDAPGAVPADLHLILRQDPSGFSGSAVFDGRTWDDPTVAALVDDYTLALATAVEDPERRISELAARLDGRVPAVPGAAGR